MTHQGESSKPKTDFIRLFSEHSRRIYWFIRTAVPNQDDADEVYQETSAALWEKFDQFELGTQFSAWAFQIARYKILEHRHQVGRDKLVFSKQFIDEVTDVAVSMSQEMDLRRRLLATCFEGLDFPDRQFIEARYSPDATTKKVAEKTGRSVSNVYRALSRIHQLLFDCIARHMQEDDRSIQGNDPS